MFDFFVIYPTVTLRKSMTTISTFKWLLTCAVYVYVRACVYSMCIYVYVFNVLYVHTMHDVFHCIEIYNAYIINKTTKQNNCNTKTRPQNKYLAKKQQRTKNQNNKQQPAMVICVIGNVGWSVYQNE